MHAIKDGAGGDKQNKCLLVSWSPLICAKMVAGSLFPDFLVTLVGIRSDDGEPLHSSAITRVEDPRTIGTNSRVYEIRGPINKNDSLRAGFSHEFITEFRNGFPMHWYDLFMEHVDRMKLAQIENIMNGDLPLTPEVLEARKFILAQMDRLQSIKPAIDAQPTSSSASIIETKPRTIQSRKHIVSNNTPSSSKPVNASNKSHALGGITQRKSTKYDFQIGGGSMLIEDDDEEDVGVKPRRNLRKLKRNSIRRKKNDKNIISMGKRGNNIRQRCRSTLMLIPPRIRVSSRGRVIKPRLKSEAGIPIGNPLRTRTSITSRGDRKSKFSDELTTICSKLGLRTSEESKQKRRKRVKAEESKQKQKSQAKTEESSEESKQKRRKLFTPMASTKRPSRIEGGNRKRGGKTQRAAYSGSESAENSSILEDPSSLLTPSDYSSGGRNSNPCVRDAVEENLDLNSRSPPSQKPLMRKHEPKRICQLNDSESSDNNSGNNDESETSHIDFMAENRGQEKPADTPIEAVNEIHTPKTTSIGSKDRFKCDTCGRGFEHNYRLQNHRRTHSGDRPFKCHLCPQTFTQAHHLKRHGLTHTGNCLMCDFCQREFTDNWHLRRHLLTHTGERPFGCDGCEKAFSDHSALRMHRLTHSGERNFICEICKSGFVQKIQLQVHKRIHTDERPYVCSLCPAAFRQQSGIIQHMKNQHRENPAEGEE